MYTSAFIFGSPVKTEIFVFAPLIFISDIVAIHNFFSTALSKHPLISAITTVSTPYRIIGTISPSILILICSLVNFDFDVEVKKWI